MPTPKEILRRFDEKIINDIRARMIATGANATGKTSQSLRSVETEGSGIIYGAEGFIDDAVQIGTRKGTLVELSKIEEWCIARGISVGLAKRIVKNIYKHGTVTVSPDNTRDIYTSIVTNGKIKKLFDDIGDVYFQTATSEIQQLIK